jgi:hypothetical protein
MNNFNGVVGTVNYAQGVSPSYQPTAQDTALANVYTAAIASITALLQAVRVTNPDGSFSPTRTLGAQNQILATQVLVTQAAATAAGVQYVIWQGTIDWSATLTAVQALIAAGF